MIRQHEIQTGVVLKFITPDDSPDLIGPVQDVRDGFAWIQWERWPLDVVAHNATVIPKPSAAHKWDGALDRWFLPSEQHTMGPDIVLNHARHG